MRLDTICEQEWNEYAPYVDSVCLPVTSISLTNKQLNLSSAKVMERLASELEQRLTGRLLLLPAIPFRGRDLSTFFSYIQDVLLDCEASGFNHLLLLLDIGYQKQNAQIESLQQDLRSRLLIHYVPIDWEGMDSELEKVYGKIIQHW